MPNLLVPTPVPYELDGGSTLITTVCRVDAGFIGIVLDPRDASNVSVALLSTRFMNKDDQEAAEKLAQLIELTLEKTD
jgi:hypothetical protein